MPTFSCDVQVGATKLLIEVLTHKLCKALWRELFPWFLLTVVNPLVSLTDCPRNIRIKHDERADLIPHEMDIICFVKKNASDPNLAQESRQTSLFPKKGFDAVIAKYKSLVTRNFSTLNIISSYSSEEAVLAMPYQFMEPILGSAPGAARPLKKADGDKRKKYLELSQVILNRFPSTSNGRGVQFLMDICTKTDPGPLYPIPFYTSLGQNDLIVIGSNPVLARVAPTVRFEARIR